MALISPAPSVKPDSQSSMPQNTSVGGGSRPTPHKTTTPDSAPTEPRTLSRAPAGWLR